MKLSPLFLPAALVVLGGASCLQVLEIEEGIPAKGASSGSGGGGEDAHSTPCPNGVSDCPAPAEPGCGEAACDAGVCSFIPVPDGTPLASDRQTDGDCGTLVCDGSGGTRTENTPDPKSDEEPCTVDTCVDGQTEHEPTSTTVDCYTPDDKTTLGKGACKGGLQQCNNGIAVGTCAGEVTPKTEDCDVEMVDEDCDGVSNEDGANCVCEPASSASCYDGPPAAAGVGDCLLGAHVCNPDGLAYDECVGEVMPAADELCDDGVALHDENCNGQTNEVCICPPNQVVTCPYFGPPNTAGIGQCKAAVQTCNATGTGFTGACTGEVVPAFDFCTNTLDEDCNASAQTCKGVWMVDGTSGSTAIRMVVASDGTVTTLSSSLGSAMRIQRVSTAGAVLWTKVVSFPNGQAIPEDLAVDANGNVAVSGHFGATVDFGGGSRTSTMTGGQYLDEIFVAKYASANGAYQWDHVFPMGSSPNSFNYGRAVTFNSSGNVVLAGDVNADFIDLGNGTLLTSSCTTASYTDAILVVLSGNNGSYITGKRMKGDSQGSCKDAAISDLSTDASGGIYLETSYGPFDLGNGASAGNRTCKVNATLGGVWCVGPSASELSVDATGHALVPAGGLSLLDTNGALTWTHPGPFGSSPLHAAFGDATHHVSSTASAVYTSDLAGAGAFEERLIGTGASRSIVSVGGDAAGSVYVFGQRTSSTAQMAQLTVPSASAPFLFKFTP